MPTTNSSPEPRALKNHADATADRIAGDIAVAIHQGLLRPGPRIPTQDQLMQAYGAARATVASAMAKLTAAGLVRGERRRGTFVVDHRGAAPNPVLEVMAAATLCRSLAATQFAPGEPAVAYVGGHPAWGTEHWDAERMQPPREVYVPDLDGLDRHLLRWLSEALLAAARRMVVTGPADSDRHLLAAARAILRNGARRPAGQPPIAIAGGPVPDAEDVALRIWPQLRVPADPDGPPF